MQDLAELISQARALHQGGQLAPAAQLYETVLARDPNHAQALHLFGVLNYQQGVPSRAVELISRAIELHPTATHS